MGIATFPAASGGLSSAIRSLQRGVAGGAGNVTITSVDISKSMVNIQGTAASGTVSASGSLNATSGNIAATSWSIPANTHQLNTFGTYQISAPAPRNVGNYNASVPLREFLPAMSPAIAATSYNSNAMSLTGGSTNLVAAQVTGFLANATTLTVSAACRYEVVEFN